MKGHIYTIIILNDQYERNDHSDNIVRTHFPSFFFPIVRMFNNADIINYLMEQDDRDEQSTKKKKIVDESTDVNPDKDNISNR